MSMLYKASNQRENNIPFEAYDIITYHVFVWQQVALARISPLGIVYTAYKCEPYKQSTHSSRIHYIALSLNHLWLNQKIRISLQLDLQIFLLLILKIHSVINVRV